MTETGKKRIRVLDLAERQAIFKIIQKKSRLTLGNLAKLVNFIIQELKFCKLFTFRHYQPKLPFF